MNPEWEAFLAEIKDRRTAAYDIATDLSDEGKDAERALGKVDGYDEVLRLISHLGASPDPARETGKQRATELLYASGDENWLGI